jgi:ParB family chromosome partitioning protein
MRDEPVTSPERTQMPPGRRRQKYTVPFHAAHFLRAQNRAAAPQAGARVLDSARSVFDSLIDRSCVGSGDAVDQKSQENQPRAAGGRRGGLGRGLDSLIPTMSGPDHARPSTVDVPIDAISPNPYQPRTTLDQAKLELLAQSIRTHGVIQPLIVTASDDGRRYTLIAGERRWRAARLAGIRDVPVVVKEAASQAMLELALVENVVRADLSPLEEATAYRQLIDEFGLTQASVAERVGRSRVSVTNTLRLLAAPEEVQLALEEGKITEGHARALLGLPTAVDQVAMLEVVIERAWNVRQTEDAVRRWVAGETKRPAPVVRRDEDEQLQDQLQKALTTKVTVKRDQHGAGAITIHFFSDEQLRGIYERLGGNDDW